MVSSAVAFSPQKDGLLSWAGGLFNANSVGLAWQQLTRYSSGQVRASLTRKIARWGSLGTARVS